MVRDGEAEALDRLLMNLETAFRAILLVLLVLTVLGQVALSAEEGRTRLSRADRLEGVKLRVVQKF